MPLVAICAGVTHRLAGAAKGSEDGNRMCIDTPHHLLTNNLYGEKTTLKDGQQEAAVFRKLITHTVPVLLALSEVGTRISFACRVASEGQRSVEQLPAVLLHAAKGDWL